jgi:hypothetical protein
MACNTGVHPRYCGGSIDSSCQAVADKIPAEMNTSRLWNNVTSGCCQRVNMTWNFLDFAIKVSATKAASEETPLSKAIHRFVALDPIPPLYT